MKTKVILEFGANHQGDEKIAQQMTEAAADLGVWAVKYQKRDVEGMPKAVGDAPRDPDKNFGATYREHRRALEFSIDQLRRMRNLARERGLAFGVTAHDVASLAQLLEMDVEFVKLPSQWYSHYAMNQLLFNQRKIKTMVSTGMHDLGEILNWQYFGCADYTMYCRSVYPADPVAVTLSWMTKIADALRLRKSSSMIGYSSHEVGGKSVKASVLAGATVIERHFTLDKKMKGHDHATVSSDPDEMKRIMDDIREAERMLGDIGDAMTADELAVRKAFRWF